MQDAHTVSHFQRAVLKIGNYLIVLAVALVTVIIVISVIRGDPILTTLQFALVLTVAAIPVAMPTVLSVTMAVGARLLAKKKAIVSRLVAIEELAGVDVLCADKTGTLTQNTLTLGIPFTVERHRRRRRSSSTPRSRPAPTTTTPSTGRSSAACHDDKALHGYHVVHFQPFDPVHKRTEATVKAADGTTFKVTKGAPQVILALAANASAIKTAVDKAVNDFAARGLSVVGCGPSRRRRRLAVRRRPAAVRPAPRRRQSDHRHRARRWASPSRWLPATRSPSRRRPPPKSARAPTSSTPPASVT